ncbi:MAG TPA: hypothetical protein PLR28_02040 [Dokdonella sp.]|uniref:hypothetical protein n=1 Tax=Dokdonella sp. TaxID=2291710 RepID=UPI002BBA86AF|nr:hypothetical protein [Dokdonella sp.]HOX71638.1 hypothetical protein [Dokdonella sp.]HPG93317.1 hypothetical protein [Dokdonella sp.]
MNAPRDPDHDLERLLDADAGEFGAIYRRLSRPEPPRRLDRVVIANAARAVQGGRAPPAQRWLFGVGSVAGLVLAAGIAWQVGKQIDTQETQTRPDQAGRSVIAVQPISESARLQKSEVLERDAAITDKQAPAAAAAQAADQAPAPQARKKTARPPALPAAAPPPPPPPPPMQENLAQPEPAPALSAADEARAFPEAKDDASSGAAADALGELKRGERPVASTAGRAATMSAPKAAAEQSRAPAPSTSVKLRQNMHLAPQDWLAEIVRLKHEGQRQEAIENLRLFRRMYPDWQLSDELRRLAE